MLEIESSNTCDSGLSEEAEVHWEEDKKQKLARCSNLKHTFQRTARDCPDVKFLMLEVWLPFPCLQLTVDPDVQQHAIAQSLLITMQTCPVDNRYAQS